MKFKNILVLAMSLLSIVGCNKSNENIEYPEYVDMVNKGENIIYDEVNSSVQGKNIEKITSYSANSLYSPENLVNDSGMSGKGSINHTHSSLNPRDNMWISRSGEENVELILIFETNISLGHLYLYNYNNFAKITSSIKTFKILYSIDGVTFNSFNNNHEYELSINDGKSDAKSSLIDGKPYLDLGGIRAKYLKIIPLTNYGGTAFGLSEVRIFKEQKELKKGNILPSYPFSLGNKAYNANFEKTLNGSALSSLRLDGTISNNPFYMYSATRSEYVISFNGQFPLDKVYVWNYNAKDNLENGIKEFELSYSIDGDHFEKIAKYNLNKASGENNEKAVSFSLNNVHVQYIKIKYLSNFGGKEYGLGNIFFTLGEGYYSLFDNEHTGLLSSYQGWSGADGVFNTRLNGDQSIGGKGTSIFNFSDSYIGEVDSITKHRKNTKMVNNSFGIYDGKNINFLIDDVSLPLIAIKDEKRSMNDCFYWLGDTFVNKNVLYISALYIAKQGALGFEQVAEDLYAVNIKDGQVDFSSKRLIKDKNNNKLCYIDNLNKKSVIFGAAIFENTSEANALNPDEYIYNYGYLDTHEAGLNRQLVVSRVHKDFIEDFSKYEYLAKGETWSKNIQDVYPLTNNNNVSCEMSVSEINNKDSKYYGKFILCYSKNTTSREVCISVSSSLTSGFKNELTIYHSQESILNNKFTQYNAKIHPTLSTNDYLVMSYNVNEASAGANATNADIYRPRFVKIGKIKE